MQKTKLLGKENIAEGTKKFTLERPEGFVFEAGQTIDVTLPNPSESDAKGNSRTFSLCSAPHDDFLEVATRMTGSAFKNSFDKIEGGGEVEIEGPFGSFTLHENKDRPAVMLVGGIGITPFRGIIRDAVKRDLPHEIYLFYSNRRPEDSAFLEELSGYSESNHNIHMIATMTDMANSSKQWKGEEGYIDAKMISKYAPMDSLPIFYIAGPPGLVKAMKGVLSDMEISKDDIKLEEFAGY